MYRVSAALILTLVCLCPAVGAETGWVFRQTSMLKGEQTLTVSPRGLKHESMGIVIAATQPDWNVIVYNTKLKNVFDTKGRIESVNVGVNSELLTGDYFSKLRLKPESRETLSGVNTQHYIMRSTAVTDSGENSKNIKRWISRAYVIKADMWATNVLEPPPQMQKILYELYKLPSVSGIPVKMTYVDSTGKTTNELVTKSVIKSTLESNTFATPKGYRTAMNISEVAVIRSKKMMDNMAEMFNDWRGSASDK